MEEPKEEEYDMVTVRCDEFKAMEAELKALRTENADLKKSYTKLRNQLTEADVDKLELNAELAAVKETMARMEKECNELVASHERKTAALKAKISDCEDRIREVQEEEKRKENVIFNLHVNMEKLKKPIREDQLQDANFISFYTGLNYSAFSNILDHVGLRLSASELKGVLAPWQSLLLTLMRLKLSLTLQDLAYRFGVSNSTAGYTFERWLFHCYTSLECFIKWPERYDTKMKTPEAFKNAFSDDIAVILYCLELHPERSKAADARTEAELSGKGQRGVRYMVGVTPARTISYVSRGWDNSDEVDVLLETGFYNRLLPGDEFLADHSLSSSGRTGWYRAKVLEADDDNGEMKLSSRDITDARKLVLIRSHLDKITSLRRRYRILRGDLPIQGLHKKSRGEDHVSQIDQIVRVCCALSNIAENSL